MDIDLVVLGAGPGGCAAALDAARQGARVTLVEPWTGFSPCRRWMRMCRAFCCGK